MHTVSFRAFTSQKYRTTDTTDTICE